MRKLRHILLALALAASASGVARAEDPPDYPRAPVRPGDRCIVGGGMLDESDTVFIVKGRRVPVAAGAEEEFLRNADAYFSKLQARGALFQETAADVGLRGGWLYFGLYVLAGLACGGLAAYVAVNRGHAPLPWFFAGLFANVLGVAGALTRKRTKDADDVPPGLARAPTTRRPSRCPACGFEVHPSARVCPGCKSALTPSAPSEAEAARA